MNSTRSSDKLNMLGGPESLKYEISTSCYSNRVIGAPHGRCYVDSKYLLECNDGLDKAAVSHWGVNTSGGITVVIVYNKVFCL